MKKNNLKISITTGDVDGIGSEVTAKALAKLGPQRGVHFYLWRSPAFPKKHLRLIDKKFYRKTFSSWSEALQHPPTHPREILDISSPMPPPRWVETSAEAGSFGHIDALVTAPLSKTLIRESGMKDIGHTDILSRVCRRKELFMAFLGHQFHVLLTTGHLPLEIASQRVDRRLLKWSLLAADELNRVLSGKKKKRPIALVGLNPHAGEEGLIGDAEQKIFLPLISELHRHRKLQIEGPLVPDAAFLPTQWKKYGIYVCPYHDQGLIPFKMAHQHKSGCHITMGLPFIRTSVEHGTAKDLFGKEKADESSMLDALKWAIYLGRNGFKPDDYFRERSIAE